MNIILVRKIVPNFWEFNVVETTQENDKKYIGKWTELVHSSNMSFKDVEIRMHRYGAAMAFDVSTAYPETMGWF